MKLKTIHKKLYWLQAALCLLLCLIGVTEVRAEPAFKVGFVMPSEPDDPFFSELKTAMEAAARDLNIELIIEHSGRNMPVYARKYGRRLMQTHKPHYFLTGGWSGGAKYHLYEAEKLDIETFVINAPVGGNLAEVAPRKDLPNWLGQMTPDNVQGGHLLADVLIEEARSRKLTDADGKVHLVALSGNSQDTTSLQRLEGLKARVGASDDVILHEVVLAGWQKDTAYRETQRLLEKYPDMSVIWAASDHMALGAAEAAEQGGRKPGENIMIGGFDWNEQNLHDIKNGRLTASIGGHVLEGAWVLVLLYDYHRKKDFAGELGTKFTSPMHVLTSKTIDQYPRMLHGMDWDKVDFKRFSKAHNTSLRRYDFSLRALFNAVADDGSSAAVNVESVTETRE